MATPSPSQERLYSCIDDFINHDYIHTLIKSMESLQINYILHNPINDDLEEEDKAAILNTIRDANRITTFIVELSELFSDVE